MTQAVTVLVTAFCLLLLIVWWRSAAPGPGGAEADGGRVIVLQPMAMAALARTRTIRIYLPPGYATGDHRYPVIYMHDGQNLFDEATSYAGEWAVDETLDAMAAEQADAGYIVVGVDNGGELRMNELSPWPNPQFGEAQGEGYLQFLVEQVKPMVDRDYRTLAGREHTAIMGSSMGGLISHYAICAYPDVFSKAGILSPSYWFSDEVWAHTASHPPPEDARLYLLIGTGESQRMQDDLGRMERQLLAQGHPEGQLIARRGAGDHNEAFWRGEFPAVVRFLFAPTDALASAP